MKLHYLTKHEAEMLERELNLSDDESDIFWMLTKNKSIVEISSKLNLSERTVNRRIAKIKEKIKRL